MKRHAVAAMVGLAGLLAACSSSPTKGSAPSPNATGVAGQSAAAGETSTATPGTTGTATAKGSTGSGSLRPQGSTSSPTPATLKGATPGQKTTPAPGTSPGTNNSGDPSISIGPVIQLSPETAVSGGTPGATHPAATPSPAPTCSTSGPTVPAGPVNSLGITNVQFATSLASDGSAVNPRTVFSAALDPKIIAVATLNNLPPGTQINYVHVHGTCFTPSSTFTLKQTLKHFYIQFAAQSPNTLTPGHYRVRYYINQQPAYDASYDIQ